MMRASTPLLLVVAGPARGRAVPVGPVVSIGRDEQSGLAIADRALSRHHCTIELTSEGVLLRDLESRNGCWVNGAPVTQRVLADGDRIRIGDSALLLVYPTTTAAADPNSSPPLDAVGRDQTTVSARVHLTFQGSEIPSDRVAIATGRPAPDPAVILRLSEALQRTTSRTEFQACLLSQALEAVKADAAALITVDEVTGALTAACVEQRSRIALSINRGLATRAIDERIAILANDVPADPSSEETVRRTDAPATGAMCVPLLTVRSVRSALYLVRACGTAPFVDDDLHTLTGFGWIGGLALDRLQHMERLEDEARRLRADDTLDHQMIGESAAIRTICRFVARVAPTEATVLIRGESGTGKELVAHAIHANSPRRNGPFVAINCAALPEALLESELFGHERGAFTGAVAQQRGRLELAGGGTLFLDEIGELALPLQAKLLRVLQERSVERLGGRRPIPIDVRIVAASNRDLDAALTLGAFRRDLYYRLNVVSISVPALRERSEDIPLLAACFVRRHAERCKRSVRGVSAEARPILQRYEWPGNVRELENAIERAVVLGSTDMVLAEDLPETLLERYEADSHDGRFHARVAAHKRSVIQEALHRAGGNVAAAARALGLQPTYLHRLIRNLGASDDGP
jgi:transcriptional regulator with GAF, ATPase, and Fis domain